MVKITTVLVRCLPDTSQQVLLRSVRQMCKSSQVPQGDVRLWLPVLGTLRRDEIRPMLLGIVRLPRATVRAAFLLISSNSTLSLDPMTAADLIVDVLRLEFKGVAVRRLSDLLGLFFERHDIYTDVVWATALQRIMDRADRALPTLYVRAMLLSLTAFPRLKEFMVNLMAELITPLRKVWALPLLYPGFLVLVKVCFVGVVPVCCRLFGFLLLSNSQHLLCCAVRLLVDSGSAPPHCAGLSCAASRRRSSKS